MDWPYGRKLIHHRIQRGGLISAVTESFHPSTPHDYAIFLEDDIEVTLQDILGFPLSGPLTVSCAFHLISVVETRDTLTQSEEIAPKQKMTSDDKRSVIPSFLA